MAVSLWPGWVPPCPPAVTLLMADTGRKTELFKQRGHCTSRHFALFIQSDSETGAKLGVLGSPSKTEAAGRAQGVRTESQVLQVGRGKHPGPQNPAWDWTPFPSEQQGFYKVTPSGSASSMLSLGTWPWGLCGGQPGSGHSWTTSSDHCQQAPSSCFTA